MFYTQKLYAKQLLHREAITQSKLQTRISTPKRKKHDFEALCKNNFDSKIIFAKMKKLPKHHSQLSRRHYNKFTALSCKKHQYCACSRSSEEPWRSHSTAICRDWVAEHTRLATHYCGTHRFDAPVPMHKVSQHMQSTIAQRQQRREKVTWNPQFHCVRSSRQIPRQSGDARTLRLPEKT